MRLKSGIWISALIRHVQSGGGFATVSARGEESAGAIFLIVNDYSGTLDLIAPAPQALYESGAVSDRTFETALSRASGEEVEKRLSSERSFDPDIWIVEIEGRAGHDLLDGFVGLT